MSDVHQIVALLDEPDLFAPLEPLIAAIERELNAGTFPAIQPTKNDFYRFVVERVQQELAKTGTVDVRKIVRRSFIAFRMEELEAIGVIERTGEMRASETGEEMLPVYRAKHPAGRVVIPDSDRKN